MMASIMILAGGKDMRTLVLTPTPMMHCDSCETKIKSNMRFEKGVVKIETDREKQTVEINYDARKTNVKALQAAMQKIGYQTTVVSDEPQATNGNKGKPKKK
ncbi:MAG: cation transporter [Bacteroidales bacterium]|nr:cation transporter [Bacteroidales bacterium]